MSSTGREPVPRPALRPGPAALPRAARRRVGRARRGAAQGRHHPRLRRAVPRRRPLQDRRVALPRDDVDRVPQADVGLGAAPPDRQVRAGDRAQGRGREAVAAGDRATSWTCRSGSPRRAIRPSASTWRPSTPRRPSAARTWIPAADVTEMSALVLDAKRQAGGKSGVVIFGGGAPKNFLLQTEPQLQEILGVSENAATTTSSRSPTPAPTPAACRARRRPRPCRGGRSIPTCCPTPSSATSTRPSRCRSSPRTCWRSCKPRKPRRLYKRLHEMVDALRAEYLQVRPVRALLAGEAAAAAKRARGADRSRRCPASRAAARDAETPLSAYRQG